MNVINRDNLPKLDLHGETKDVARILVEEFLEYNYMLGQLELVIIHGIGEGILKKEVHKVLKNNKKVVEFGLDMFNPGCTLVRLGVKVDSKDKIYYNMQHNLEGGY